MDQLPLKNPLKIDRRCGGRSNGLRRVLQSWGRRVSGSVSCSVILACFLYQIFQLLFFGSNLGTWCITGSKESGWPGERTGRFTLAASFSCLTKLAGGKHLFTSHHKQEKNNVRRGLKGILVLSCQKMANEVFACDFQAVDRGKVKSEILALISLLRLMLEVSL